MDSPTRRALADATRLCAEAGHPTLLVGAWARDLCLPPDAAQDAPRKTNDGDLAVRVPGWPAVEALFERARGPFEPRLGELYLVHAATGIKVDLVPCGGVEEPPGTLAIPRSTRVLNTLGLVEALEGAEVREAGELRVRVPQPEAFVLLKLLAHQDRREENDLRDLGHVLRRAYAARPLWEEPHPHLDELLFEGRVGEGDEGPWFLGRALARSFGPAPRQAFREALRRLREEPEQRRRLVAERRPFDPDAWIRAADRALAVLALALDLGPAEDAAP